MCAVAYVRVFFTAGLIVHNSIVNPSPALLHFAVRTYFGTTQNVINLCLKVTLEYFFAIVATLKEKKIPDNICCDIH